MAAQTNTQQNPIDVWIELSPGLGLQTAAPEARVALVAAGVKHSSLLSTSPFLKEQTAMDGVPQIRTGQFQRVTLLAVVRTKAKVPLVQADVQAVHCALFQTEESGGTPLGEFWLDPADCIYDTIQTALDPDGYNLEVEFEMNTDETSKGGSSYQLEVIVELQGTGEKIPVKGRVHVDPGYLLPINSY